MTHFSWFLQKSWFLSFQQVLARDTAIFSKNFWLEWLSKGVWRVGSAFWAILKHWPNNYCGLLSLCAAWYKKVFPCLKIPASFLPRKMANAKTDFSYLKISLRHITIAKHHQFSGRQEGNAWLFEHVQGSHTVWKSSAGFGEICSCCYHKAFDSLRIQHTIYDIDGMRVIATAKVSCQRSLFVRNFVQWLLIRLM